MARGRQGNTRALLIEAAFSLFEKHGYENVTVDQIAITAGVSRRTFFRYFKSKEKVAFPYADARRAAFHAMVQAKTGGAPATIDVLAEIYNEVAQSWVDRREAMTRNRRIVARSPALLIRDHDTIAKWEAAIAAELDGAGSTEDMSIERRSLRARIIAGALVGAMRPVFIRWFELDGAFDLIGEGGHAIQAIAESLKVLDDSLDL